MRSRSLRLIALVLLYLAVAAPASPFESSVDFRLLKSDSGSLRFDIQVGGVDAQIEELQGRQFARLSLSGEGISGLPGMPEIPVLRRRIMIPHGAQVTLSASADFHTLDLSDSLGASYLAPVAQPLPKCDCPEVSRPFVLNEEAYLSQVPTFGNAAGIVERGVFRGRDFITVELHPVNYIPAQGIVEFANKMTLEVSFSGADWESTKARIESYNDYRSDTISRNIFTNPEYLDVETGVEYFAPGSYLVIGSNNLLNTAAMSEFLHWKRRKGYRVVAVDLTETGTTAGAIRQFVQEAYFNWEIPPAFVLLVGDTDVLPPSDGQLAGTDLYYAAVDGEDLLADLGVGRFPARTETDLEHMVNKTLNYEQGLWGPSGWLNQAAFMAGIDRAYITEATHNAVIELMFDPAGLESERIYYNEGSETSDFFNAMDRGLAFLTYSGHGKTDGWIDGPPVSNDDLDYLDNVATPFVASFACLTGKFDEQDAFSEMWLRSVNGAVAMIASSVNSYWDEDDVLEKAMYWGLLNGSRPFNEKDQAPPIPWLSGFSDYGKQVVANWSDDSDMVTRYYEMYNLMGDPEIFARTQKPAVLEVKHTSIIDPDATEFEITVNSDAKFLMVGLTQGDRLLASGMVNPGEKSLLEIADSVEMKGEVSLVVTAYNYLPYTADIQIEGITDDDDDDRGDDTDDDDKSGTTSQTSRRTQDDESTTGACGC